MGIELFERAAELSPYFLERVFALRALPVIRDIRGFGLLAGIDLAEIAITSAARTGEGPPPDAFTLAEVADIAVVVSPDEGTKCQRCWQVLTEVASLPATPEMGEVCRRCAGAIADRAADTET